ncbi:MAG: GIY-YIG nuclease family protein [Krumholzibacteria bacterium]|nr:GIY-YIG nuclease family protein [Candidatus Krumholzibacteria bacterium]
MNRLRLLSLLEAAGVAIDRNSYKIHLATGDDFPPIDAFYAGAFKEWQENQANRNFGRDMVIGLIHLGADRWLFAGVYRVLGFQPAGERFKYETALLDGQEDLIGRLIVQHKRSARAAYLVGQPDGGPFYVAEYRAQPMAVEDFPGYNSVSISYSKLALIVAQNLDTWRGALSNMKGVYLITDLNTGKLYVGSATGNDGLWQRLCAYAASGHGGNKDLKRVLGEHGARYVENFQYSLLEVADSRATDEYILGRESFWKCVVASRQFGYNAN